MSERRPANTKPDSFPAASESRAPEPPVVAHSTAELDNPTSQPRYVLPKDLAAALKRLDDAEVDALLAAVTTEAERRGRLPLRRQDEHSAPDVKLPDVKSQLQRAPAESGAGSLTKGQLNAVRAAFKAGVKPSAIARQFGISQSDVKKAIA